jgi:hypothetical protein
VQNVRHLCVAVGLTAVLVLSGMSSGNAASSGTKTYTNISSSSNVSRASTSDVPPNCIRQSCGKLWCWQMGGGKSR